MKNRSITYNLSLLFYILVITTTALLSQPKAHAGCWKKSIDNNSYVWFQNLYCPDGSITIKWEGGNIEGFANGEGTLEIYRSDVLIRHEERYGNKKIKFGAYQNKSIIHLSNGDQYIGQVQNGEFWGRGVYIKTNGYQYFGMFHAVPDGKLSLYKNNKLIYTGNWKQGKRCGFGKQYYDDGSSYEGYFLENKKQGEGTLHTKDSEYKGLWANDKLQNGTVTIHADDNIIIINVKNGERQNKVKIIYSNGDKYKGEINTANLTKNGFGSYFYSDGSKYTGYWKNDLKQGSGVLELANGLQEKGIWRYDKEINDKKFEVIYPDGSKYSGDINNGLRNDIGTLHYADGSVYIGSWLNDKKNGHGKIVFINGDSYDGFWVNGKKTGNGKYILNNGSYYDGEWQNDLRSGFGVYVFNNGSKYKGQWFEGNRQGEGTLCFNDNTSYSGQWNNDKINGTGKLQLANGDHYEGSWVNNQKHGQGKYTWANGNTYDGNWRNDQPDGYGKFSWINGETYSGEWISGYPNKQGIYTYNNGDIYEGEWLNGEKSGYGVYTFKNGNVYKGYFKNGTANGQGTFIFHNGNIYKGSFLEGKFCGEGTLYITAEDKTLLEITAKWDGSELPERARILFSNGDLFNGTIDKNGNPINGIWSTKEERYQETKKKSIESYQEKINSKQSNTSTTYQNANNASTQKTYFQRFGHFYKKHRKAFRWGIRLTQVALTIGAVIPITAPICAPANIALNLAATAIDTVVQESNIQDARARGDYETAKKYKKRLITDSAINFAFALAPKGLSKIGKTFIGKGITKAVKNNYRQIFRNSSQLLKNTVKRVSKSLSMEVVALNTKKATKKILRRSVLSNISKIARKIDKKPRIRLTDEKCEEIIKDLPAAIRKYTGKSAKNGYIEFFLRLSPKRAKQIIKLSGNKVEGYIRSPGSQHEWLMVKHFEEFLTDPKWEKDRSQLIIALDKLRSATNDVVLKNGGIHGGKGSGRFHYELSKIIYSSKNFHDMIRNIDKYAEEVLTKRSYKKFIETFGEIQ